MDKDTQINQIIECFKFSKVHKAMVALDWKIMHDDGSFEVPTIGKLFIIASKVLDISYDRKTKVSSCGFVATYDNGILQLDFVLESWDYVHEE